MVTHSKKHVEVLFLCISSFFGNSVHTSVKGVFFVSKMNARQLAISGLIAALYIVLTLAFAGFSYGEIQFRVSEILVLLPFINPMFIPAVTIGTFISNLYGPFGLADAFAGSFASLVAMVLVWQTRRLLGDKLKSLFVASLWPVLINGLYVPTIIIALDPSTPWAAFTPIGISVAIGEFAVVSIAGVLIFNNIKDHPSLLHILGKPKL